jgi:hypothetical protein
VQTWQVLLELEDVYGCKAFSESEIRVFPQPVAMFTNGSLEGCAQSVDIQFTNQSTPGTSSLWNFNDLLSGPQNVSFGRNPTHMFSGPGEYYVTLTVQNSFGCADDHTVRLGCNYLEIYVPNAFSPDGNNINELFRPVIYGVEYIDMFGDSYYLFEIFNRWGDRIFSTKDPAKGWDGSSPNTGYYAEPEVYLWSVWLRTPLGVEKRRGHVTLIR